MSLIRILELRDTDEIGGPGKTILETARAIDANRFRVHIGVFQTRHEGTETPFIAAARKMNLPVHRIPGYNQYDPRLILRTVDLVRRLGIHIVHAHEVKSDVIAYLASLLHRMPIVTTLHGWIGNSRKQRAFIALDKRTVRSFDIVIAVSRLIAQQAVEAGVPERRVRVLNNAIVLSRYQRASAKGEVERLIGRPLRGPMLAAVGRLSREKGHSDLIDALGKLAARGRHVEAVIVGDGPELQALAARVRDLGLMDWVHFTGYLERPQTVLNEACLLVLPSHTEGLPNVALEALAMDVPVLATNVGGTPEVIIDGVTGRLVSPGDQDAIARELEDFLAAPARWRDMAVCGRQHVEKQFNFQARTKRLEEMYLQLENEARR